MKKSEFTPLAQLLGQTINHYNLDRQVKGALVCHYFRVLARELWHDGVDEVIWPKSFKDGILTIAVVDSGWAQQVQHKQHVMLARMRDVAPQVIVKSLRIRVSS